MTDITISIQTKTEVAVTYLMVDAGVRYWEDATVNGEEDEDGSRIPFKDGDGWKPFIELATGKILDWPKGTEADIHYKVCDAGKYALLDLNHQPVVEIEGYVPSIMCPEESGYGDYIIMKVDGEGQIANWRVDLGEFLNSGAPSWA